MWAAFSPFEKQIHYPMLSHLEKGSQRAKKSIFSPFHRKKHIIQTREAVNIYEKLFV